MLLGRGDDYGWSSCSVSDRDEHIMKKIFQQFIKKCVRKEMFNFRVNISHLNVTIIC